MSSLTHRLTEKGLITPPSFVPSNVQYETVMGSMAYGVNEDDSDEDVYGFCVPTREIIFPHTAGVIQGFDSQVQKFDQFQQHHIKFSDKKIYDLTIYNIIKYFRLCADCNPNIIDSLFTPQRCIKHITQLGQMVRENRKMFLSKLSWHKFKGYSYSQVKKIHSKETSSSPKRQESRNRYGYDIKYAYHVVRLLNEVEQILVEGDLDLERNREQLKSIRRGEWTKEDIEVYFTDKEKHLEKIYLECDILPYAPRESEIKQLLLNCLEHHYGSLEKVLVVKDNSTRALRKIKEITDSIFL